MSDNFEVKADRLYTKDHEWATMRAGDIEIGITAFAVDQLGDITLVNLDVKVGDEIAAGKAFGTIESVKTLSDLYAPVSGKVARVNADLTDKPELVNEDCWGKGWMLAITPSRPEEKDALLSPEAYEKLLAAAG
jgi:glycine cleavage system H protein